MAVARMDRPVKPPATELNVRNSLNENVVSQRLSRDRTKNYSRRQIYFARRLIVHTSKALRAEIMDGGRAVRVWGDG